LSHIGMYFALEPSTGIILSQLFSFVKHFLKKPGRNFFLPAKFCINRILLSDLHRKYVPA